RRVEPDERRAQIVEAAFREFGEKGFDAARLDDVARRAGIAKGTIYLHFTDKTALFRDVLVHVITRRIEALEAEPHLADPRADFVRVVRAFWDYLCTDEFPVMHRLAMSVLPRFPDLAQFFHENAGGRMRRILATHIDAMVRAGHWRDADPMEAASMLQRLLLQTATFRTIPGGWDAIRITDAEHALDRILVFLEAAMRPDTAPTHG
nr:TetR/AcrR family transcriptional regulator [Gemmatimonadaceae bacterium]